MSNKNRLGRDPLEFIKDTRNEEEGIDNHIAADGTETSVRKAVEEPKQREEHRREMTDNVINITKARIHLKVENDRIIFAIDGDLNIYSADQAKNIIIDYSKGYSEIDIDLSSIRKIDTAGYQLLLFFKKEMKTYQKTLNLHNASEEVNSIFNLYGEAC